MVKPSIEMMRLGDLVPYARNARTHSAEQVEQIAASIAEFGFTNPVLVDAAGGIIAGHGRVTAAGLLDMLEVPCIRLSHLTDAQRRAYVIADNQIALNAGWDDELLALELGELHAADFDMALLGFDAGELSAAMGLDEELDGEAPKIDEGIDYKEKFAILVDCADEAEQQATFERLDSMGFTCKVLVN
jgi:ParB-like chromosome segregation protein Spo0J